MERTESNHWSWEKWSPEAFDGRARHTESGEVLAVLEAPYDLDEQLSLDGVYEHYKSTPNDPKFYQVLFVVRDTETDERLVIYRPLYGTGEQQVSARPLRLFTGSVMSNEAKVARFRFIETE